jgi:hypothetical protein
MRNSVGRKSKMAHRYAALLSIAYCLLSPSALMAISSNAGTSAGSFLKIPTDARGVALGPAMVVMAEGTEAMRWNPAALGLVDTKEFAATHVQYYQDIQMQNFTMVYPFDQSAIGANLFYLSPGELEGRDTAGNLNGDFSFYDLVGGVGYGRELRSREEGNTEIYAGGVLKVAQEKIADYSTTNPALDAGLLIVPNEALKLGVMLRNLSAGKADFPKEIVGGASLTMIRVLTGGLALKYADDAPIRIAAAAEYRFPDLQGAALRLGYQSHDSLDDSEDAKIKFLQNQSLAGITLGAGFEYRPPMFKTLDLMVDYGMAPFGSLGIAHTLTLKVKW